METLTKYKVVYECIEDSPGWGKKGDRVTVAAFDSYDLQKFSDTAPKNWEIREIISYQVADR